MRMLPLASAITLLMTGCLFDEAPPCRIGGDACGAGLVCIDRACVLPGAAPDRGSDPDGARPDAAGDAARPDADLDGDPPDASDAAGADRGPETDGAPPDTGPLDRGPAPDLGPQCPDERCNGLDDDCDGEVDEDTLRCAIPGHCRWRHRGHQSYLFCDRPVSEAEALVTCTQTLALTVAVTDTCEESAWIWATGNLVPEPVIWENNARGRGWWLGMRLGLPDDGESIARTDRAETPPLPAGGCWGAGEPDDVILGETCVSLLYNPMTDDFGWNDDHCGDNAANPINALCETPCDPEVDADGDGEDACVDCDDRDPEANHGEGIDRCALAPEEGFPP